MAAKNPAGPSSIAAIQSEKRSYVFYSEHNGNLSYLKSQVEREASPTHAEVPPYVTDNIVMKGRVVTANTTSPQIAAVSYSLNNQNEIRVYYISDEGKLQELCRTNGGAWSAGSLNDLGEPASRKSLLTASVDYTNNGELKLYYNRENDPAVWCAWVTLGEQAWSSREINHGY